MNLTLLKNNIAIIKMRYTIERRGRKYVKDYGFLSFAKIIATNATKVVKTMSNSNSQKLLDSVQNVMKMQ